MIKLANNFRVIRLEQLPDGTRSVTLVPVEGAGEIRLQSLPASTAAVFELGASYSVEFMKYEQI